MGTFQVGLLLIGTFALLLALSVPVSVSIIISSVVTMASTLSLDLALSLPASAWWAALTASRCWLSRSTSSVVF